MRNIFFTILSAAMSVVPAMATVQNPVAAVQSEAEQNVGLAIVTRTPDTPENTGIMLISEVGAEEKAQEVPIDSLEIFKLPELEDWQTLDSETIKLEPSYLYMPLIFEHQGHYTDPYKHNLAKMWHSGKKYSLEGNRGWLDKACEGMRRNQYLRYQVIANNPENVKYNENTLPEPPKMYVITTNPDDNMLKIEAMRIDDPQVQSHRADVKVHNWLHRVQASVHFSQAFVSKNWYQGGNSSLNVTGDFSWQVELNPNVHKKILFSNIIRYRVGVNSSPADTLRNYYISEDLFTWDTNFGVKAVKNWYYSATMHFKTQLFNSYNTNSMVKRASLMSPAELNVGLGLTYNKEKKNFQASFSLAPLSYDLMVCLNDKDLNVTSFGIDEGKKCLHKFGSNIDGRITWKISPKFAWTSHLYAFTNYKMAQGDFENTLDMTITRHLTTRVSAHLRYDSTKEDVDWRYWQLKEMLSIGLTYLFSTN